MESEPTPSYKIQLYVAPTKQMERMEWMVEKCVEFGIHEKTAISALKQSKNLYLPEITGLHVFKDIAVKEGAEKLFAFISNPPVSVLSKVATVGKEYHVLVGPEGSSFLSPRAYAILHRMHHAFSDTKRDPHSP
eukprot:gene38408-50429_t